MIHPRQGRWRRGRPSGKILHQRPLLVPAYRTSRKSRRTRLQSRRRQTTEESVLARSHPPEEQIRLGWSSGAAMGSPWALQRAGIRPRRRQTMWESASTRSHPLEEQIQWRWASGVAVWIPWALQWAGPWAKTVHIREELSSRPIQEQLWPAGQRAFSFHSTCMAPDYVPG